MFAVTFRQEAVGKFGVTILLGCAVFAGFLRAQEPPQPPPPVSENAPVLLPQESLNQLLAPIALYPDALIALILPASTVPSDLVLAARFLASSGDPAQAANQPWDESVKSLVQYPDIVKWMDQNLEWTAQVGDAFLNQPDDVMNTIQQLRAQAKAAGNLVDSPEQKIVEEENCIRIVPAQPEFIYVPQYDPEVIYVERYDDYAGPALAFGVGLAVGPWLNFDCDWPRRRLYRGDWKPGWTHERGPGWRGDWNGDRGDQRDPGWRPDRDRGRGGDQIIGVVNISPGSARVWEPSARVRREQWQRQHNARTTANRNIQRRGADEASRSVAPVARPSLPNQGAPRRRSASPRCTSFSVGYARRAARFTKRRSRS